MAFSALTKQGSQDFSTRGNPLLQGPLGMAIPSHRVLACAQQGQLSWSPPPARNQAQTRMSDLPLIQSPAVLRTMAQNPGQACTCALKNCQGWTSITETQWPQAQLPAVASLRDPDVTEPTFEEHHPHGTRYGDPQAPVSLAHFPSNRCLLHACGLCGQHVMRYTEFGGYYIDHRARRLDPSTIVDTPE